MFRTGIRGTRSLHTTPTFRGGLAAIALAAAAALGVAAGSALAAPLKGGAAQNAMIGEPQTVHPMASTAEPVRVITQHVDEFPFTFAIKLNVTPMLGGST